MHLKPYKWPILLTVPLSHLQQDGLLQHNDEGFVLLVLLIVNDLHIQQLPEREDGAISHRWENWTISIYAVT